MIIQELEGDIERQHEIDGGYSSSAAVALYCPQIPLLR